MPSDVHPAPDRVLRYEPAGSRAVLLDGVLERLPHAVLAVDADWRVVVANARARAVLGRVPETVLGVTLWELVPGLDASEIGHCCRRAVAHGRALDADGTVPGLRGWFRVHAVPGPGGQLVLHVRDVSAERRLAAEVSHLTDRDALTGAASRGYLTEQLAQAVAHARSAAPDAGARGAAMLLLDLDGFTALNAARGHDVGDRLLRHAAERLGHAARGADVVARVGPDEFAVLLQGIAPDEEVIVGERLLAVLAAPVALDAAPTGRASGGAASPATVHVTACLGAVVVDGEADAEAVLRDATVALARARAAGPGRLARFTPALHAEARARDALVTALRDAVDALVAAPPGSLPPGSSGFTLAYQPVVDLATGTPTGVEALLRWAPAALGAVSPATFIPLAEELGLVPPIGRWVLREACAAIAALAVHTPAGDRLTVAVNASGHQLQASGFADEVAAALTASGLAPARLTIEVTETALVRDPRRARRVLGELRAMGVRVAIDDFGTGYSSLGYLQQLPLDVLKIDKRFVDGVARGGPSVAIPRAIVALGEALGLRTVGEGVETAPQRDALRALGCGYGQGYLFARPLTLPGLEAWLDAEVAGGAGP